MHLPPPRLPIGAKAHPEAPKAAADPHKDKCNANENKSTASGQQRVRDHCQLFRKILHELLRLGEVRPAIHRDDGGFDGVVQRVIRVTEYCVGHQTGMISHGITAGSRGDARVGPHQNLPLCGRDGIVPAIISVARETGAVSSRDADDARLLLVKLKGARLEEANVHVRAQIVGAAEFLRGRGEGVRRRTVTGDVVVRTAVVIFGRGGGGGQGEK
mmetsp:Transcript_53484/g.160050  ORF Transcript_53484/g.160050 Transcript_53484/m.160050 type:complete len:215 (-) Transcript_53484:670-1314(-)